MLQNGKQGGKARNRLPLDKNVQGNKHKRKKQAFKLFFLDEKGPAIILQGL